MNTTQLATFGLILIGASSLGCGVAPRPASPSDGRPAGEVYGQQHERVVASVLELVLHCERYEGRLVTTLGIGTLAFEKHVLCPSADLAYDSFNCLWLETKGIPEESYEAIASENGEVWVVDGFMRCNAIGHLTANPAALSDLQLVIHNNTGRILLKR